MKNELLNQKVSRDPFSITIGDKIYYIKKCPNNGYYTGCAYITDIVINNTVEILTLEGSAKVNDVSGIMVYVNDVEEKRAYKLALKMGEFIYDYEKYLLTIATMEE